MAQYTAVFTTYGTQQLAKAIANNKPLTATHFAVGDGNGNAVTVSASQEHLVNEKYRATISAVSLDPRNNKQVIFELTVPEDIGGFYIREMGVFDANNKLVAYANCPESFKPTLASGSGKVQVMRMILLVASSNAVTLTVDDSVIFVTRGQLTPQTITANSANGFDNTGHSHAIDKASTTKAGIVQLTNDTGLDSENLGLTAKAGKVLAQGIAALRLALNNYIPLNKRSSAVNSNSNENVATSAAVKMAYDKGVEAKTAADNAQSTANDGVSKANNAQMTANSANDNANTRVSKNGDTITGDLSFRTGDWSGFNLHNTDGYYLRLEGNNHANDMMLTLVYRKPNGENVAAAFFPKRNGTIAYVNDVVSKAGDTMTGALTVPQLVVNDAGNNNNFIQIGDDTKLIDVDIYHTVGLQTTDDSQDIYVAYGKNKKRFGFDGANFRCEAGLLGDWFAAGAKGAGAFDQQFRSKEAPYVVNNPNANGSNAYYPFIKGFNSNGDGWGTAFSMGYMTPNGRNKFGSGVIHLIADNGQQKFWWFGHDGSLEADDFKAVGKKLSLAHQKSDAFVETTTNNWGGLIVRYPERGMHFLYESDAEGVIRFIQRKDSGENIWSATLRNKTGTVALLDDVKTVMRKDYSITIKGTRADWDNATSKNISVTGYVCIYPDGRIEQFFYFRNFRVNWFDFEPIRDGHFRQVEIPVQLWTAMPNKVTWVEAHISRTNDTNIWSQRTVGAEAGEWTKPIWGFEKQGSIKDRTTIYTRRINGDTGETVDMMIKVEGY